MNHAAALQSASILLLRARAPSRIQVQGSRVASPRRSRVFEPMHEMLSACVPHAPCDLARRVNQPPFFDGRQRQRQQGQGQGVHRDDAARGAGHRREEAHAAERLRPGQGPAQQSAMSVGWVRFGRGCSRRARTICHGGRRSGYFYYKSAQCLYTHNTDTPQPRLTARRHDGALGTGGKKYPVTSGTGLGAAPSGER